MNDLFDCTRTTEGKSLMAAAKKFVAQMDATDRSSVADLELAIGLRTVITAITSGIDGVRWDSVCEGLFMLQQIESRVRVIATARPTG